MARRNGWASKVMSAAFLLACAAAAEAQQIGLSSAKEFHQGGRGDHLPTVTVTCAGGYWSSVNDIRLIIPPGLNFTWDTSITTISVGGPMGPNVATTGVTYANSNKTCVINVTTTFTPGSNATISGLKFANFGAPCSGQLGGSWSGNNTTPDIGVTAPQALAIVNNPTMTSGANQQINPPGPVAANTITITDGANPGIWATKNLRITIPAGLNCTWNTGVTTVAISMNPAAPVRVATTLLAYEDGNKTAVLNVTSDFLAGDQVTITGLQFTAIGADSGPPGGPFRLTCTTNGPSGAGATGNQATDNRTKSTFGLPTLSSAANQIFTTGNPSTLTSVITVTSSPVTPSKVTSANGIKLIIPAGLHMTWDTSIQTRTNGLAFGGAGATHFDPSVSNIIATYSVDKKTCTLSLISDFAVNQAATISGLKFTSFTSSSPALSLTLNTTLATDTDNRTISIGAPTLLSSVAPPGQVFPVDGNPNLTIAAANIVVSDDAQIPAINRIKSAQGIRIRIPTIPSVNPMVWDTTVTSVTCTGNAVSGGFMTGSSPVTYEDTNHTVVIPVANNWVGNLLKVTISGLVFKNFTTAMAPRQLQLVVNGAGGTSAGLDPRIIAIGGTPKLDSFADQSFTFNDPATTALLLKFTDANGVATITAANGITLKIPPGFPMEWDTTRQSRNNGLVFAGSGVGHIDPGAATNIVSYSPDAKTATVAVLSNFAINEILTIDGMRFQNFSGTHDLDNLQFFVDPVGAAVLDSKFIGIGRPTIAMSATQSFGVGDPPTVLNPITITEDSTIFRLRSAVGILIRIPAGLSMQFDTSVHALTDGLAFSGSGQGHVSAGPTIVTYPDALTALIALQSDFNPGEVLTVSGLKATSFGGVSGPLGLGLDASGLASLCSVAPQTISIGARPILTSIVTKDTNGNGSIDHLELTFDKPIEETTSSVFTGLGFSVTSPAYTIGAGVGSGNVVTFTLVEKGTPDTGVRPMLSYDPASGNIQDTTGLATSFTGPAQADDGAAPIIIGVAANDTDGNGHLNTIVFTFSEIIQAGQEDVADWRIIDADGTTNLLLGLTASSMLIGPSSSTVTFTLTNGAGTTGTPRYLYSPDPINPLHIQDPFSNSTLSQTNVLPPVVDVGNNIAVGPSKVTLDASRSSDPQGQLLTFSWSQIGGPPITTIDGADTATPSFLATAAGTYTLTVTVRNQLSFATADIQVVILNVAPGANAGVPQTASPFSNVYLVALASSDANGDPLTFTWIQTGGVSVGALNTVLAGDAVVNFTAPTPAVPPAVPDNILTFNLTATDGTNISLAQTTVRINGGGVLAPTANAGPDQVAVVGSLVTLDGSRSLDPTGGVLPLNYKWISSTPLSSTTVVNPTFTPTLPGLYMFKLVVTNPNAGVGLDSFPSTINVLVTSAANQAPVATAHRFLPVGEISVGDLVVLDATGSKDPEGLPVTYAWLQTNGPQVILANPGSLQPSFTPVRDATYAFQLTVSDGVNESRPDVVTLTVKNLPSDVTFKTTASYGSGILPDGHALLGGAKDLNVATTDPGNTWFFYLSQTGGPSLTFNQLVFGSPNLFTFTPTVPGFYSFRISATSFNAIQSNAFIDVVVDNPPADSVPTANAGLPQTVTAETTVTLDATQSRNEPAATFVGLSAYWVQREGAPVALSSPYAPNPTFTPKASGQYTFELTVADATSQSAPSFVVITVNSAPAAAPLGGGGGSGCGSVGLEWMLLLPMIWMASLLRHRIRERLGR